MICGCKTVVIYILQSLNKMLENVCRANTCWHLRLTAATLGILVTLVSKVIITTLVIGLLVNVCSYLW